VVKPVSFNNAPHPAPKKKEQGPTPLSFPPAPPKVPLVPTSTTPKPLSFDNVRVPPKSVAPAPLSSKPSPAVSTGIHGDALKHLRTKHPDLVRQEELAIVRQLQQLLPLNIVVILDWGTKTMERMRDDTREATNFVTMFMQANGNDLIERAIDAIRGTTTKGFFDRLLSKTDDPVSLEPSLAALQAQLVPWMTQIDDRIVSAKKHNFSTMVKLATLAAVADTIDQITDNSLDLAINNRRMILQQGVTQSELTIKSLEDIRQQIIDQKMRIDQVLNITLPAYKAARSRR
jgi:hypothetical protein